MYLVSATLAVGGGRRDGNGTAVGSGICICLAVGKWRVWKGKVCRIGK